MDDHHYDTQQHTPVVTPVDEPRAHEPWDGITRPQRLTSGARFLTDVILEPPAAEG